MSAQIKSEFSWSKSRDALFQDCPRQYYYNYYAYWGGWETSAPEEIREIYILKKLKTRQMWAGEHVHQAVHRSILNISRGVTVLDLEKVIDITLNMMRNEFRFSKRSGYRHKKGCALFEHEYGLDVSDDEWRSTAADVETCLRNFYGSELFSQLACLPRENILETEELSSFDFEGTRIWAMLDAAWRTDNLLTIADWKTGRTDPGGHELQMTGYALYAAEKWGVDPGDLVLLEYNLLSNLSHRYRADKATVERTLSYIRGSITDMKSLLEVEQENIPQPEEAFAKVLTERICQRCNFQKVCRPALD